MAESTRMKNLETIVSVKTNLYYLHETVWFVVCDIWDERRSLLSSKTHGPYASGELVFSKKQVLLKKYFEKGYTIEGDGKERNEEQWKKYKEDKINSLKTNLMHDMHDAVLETEIKKADSDYIAENKKGELFYNGEKILFDIE